MMTVGGRLEETDRRVATVAVATITDAFRRTF
jgi:hypothetical protein